MDWPTCIEVFIFLILKGTGTNYIRIGDLINNWRFITSSPLRLMPIELRVSGLTDIDTGKAANNDKCLDLICIEFIFYCYPIEIILPIISIE